jgi:hypothetical protein
MRMFLWIWGFIQSCCLVFMLIFGGMSDEWIMCFAAPPFAALFVMVLSYYRDNYGVPVIVLDDRSNKRNKRR